MFSSQLHLLSPPHPFCSCLPFDLSSFFSPVIFPPVSPFHRSDPPLLLFFFPPPSLSPSLCSLSPMIPGSVSASRLSALKLSQRRSVAGRNPVLRGNYLPHRLLQHTQSFTVQFNLPIPHANGTHELTYWCFSVLHENLRRLPLSSFVR